jgi:hypothetical protein
VSEQPPKQTYKAILWDYDSLLTYTDEECCYSLSEREVQLLLSGLDYINWITRYKPTETAISQPTIDKWQANLARKLMSGCCPDNVTNQRYNAEGHLEVSTDGGETWEVRDDLDPRFDGIIAPPLAGEDGTDKQCNAAQNAVDYIRAMADETITALGEGATIVSLIAAIVGLIVFLLGVVASGGLLTPLLIGLGAGLIATGGVAFDAAMTEEVYDRLLCSIYCNSNNDGSVTEAQWQEIKAEITSNEEGIAEKFLYDTINAMGVVGLTNAMRSGVNDAAVCDCDCVPYCENADSFSYGTVNSVTDNMDGTITFNVTSVDNGSGTQFIQWGDRENPASPCCTFFSYVDEVALGALGGALQECGSGTEIEVPPSGGQCYHFFLIYHNFNLSTPFTGDFTFEGSCP